LLWFFLFIIIGGSFACIQVLNEAIKTRAIGQIVSMVLVELAVALFEVLFLYRALIAAITPWPAQRGYQLGIVGTLGLALRGWGGVMGRRVAALVLALGVVACSPSQRAETPRSTLVIGLDISGSFRRNPSFNGAIEFASLYICGHLNGVGGLQPNTAIFVGELGGERTGQAKVF